MFIVFPAVGNGIIESKPFIDRFHTTIFHYAKSAKGTVFTFYQIFEMRTSPKFEPFL